MEQNNYGEIWRTLNLNLQGAAINKKMVLNSEESHSQINDKHSYGPNFQKITRIETQ